MGCSHSYTETPPTGLPVDYPGDNGTGTHPQLSREESGIMSFLRQMSTSSLGDGPVDTLSATHSPDPGNRCAARVPESYILSNFDSCSESSVKDDISPVNSVVIVSTGTADKSGGSTGDSKLIEQLTNVSLDSSCDTDNNMPVHSASVALSSNI
mmetsp:Transcript_3164/g.4902  ORF Transcript_3164/g.4902 Transcript_3164/m.4902 type:complete len:154 (+) Transcript_3164:115-576(+)|eukprot:CAMPEP_0185039204 /NCGR_PEP_ID=MMETSP1103-20130426/35803_1 /TAXON_ID=36769 /ORGANISM="Paraphysomonas bandaiensis, Strain Caron Lab Isolate" /LENGTH=153 /DNA_ID=CAMNT_0027577999 /DNA_START=54 /DNA_END=515 /DNA_ORIENTATION=-